MLGSATDGKRSATQGRIALLFNGAEKGIKVKMDDRAYGRHHNLPFGLAMTAPVSAGDRMFWLHAACRAVS